MTEVPGLLLGLSQGTQRGPFMSDDNNAYLYEFTGSARHDPVLYK